MDRHLPEDRIINVKERGGGDWYWFETGWIISEDIFVSEEPVANDTFNAIFGIGGDSC